MDARDTSSSPMPDLAENLPRRVLSTVYAENAEDIRQAVLSANESRTPIYPISRGLNWGLGSRNPVKDDCVLLDLSRMNRILQLDLERGYAVIEAGVSQGALSDRLDGTPYLLNVTTSCRDSSVVGNALDRGQGMLRLRIHDLMGVDVVLGNGTALTAGMTGADGESRRHGARSGPDLSQIFCQSNFGVVTAATISLIPRPERTSFVYGSFEGSGMPELVDALARLRREGVFRSIFYMGEMQLDAGARRPPDFTALGPLIGRRQMVKDAEEIMREELGRLASCKNLRIGAAEDVEPTDALYLRARMFLGTPTCEMIRKRFGTTTCDLDASSKFGWSVVQTLLPQDGNSVNVAMSVLKENVEDYQLAAQPHLSTVSSRAINLMTMIWFERTPAGIDRMRKMRDRLSAQLGTHGFHPSREGIDALRAAASNGRDAGGLAQLKAALDPNGIIAPGRYG